MSIMCSSRKSPYPPLGRSLEIPRGRGVLKVKILEANYGNLSFLNGFKNIPGKAYVKGVHNNDAFENVGN